MEETRGKALGGPIAQTKVSDLSVDEFKKLIRDAGAETLAEMLGDPDEGLERREDLRVALQRSPADVEAGAKTIPAQEVAAKASVR
ncbi:MAG: hypothetical protein QHH80_09550 [Anaerolineae bacterium]|nr:hypothetical protein [Anaerolineae bacterium]